MAKLTDKQKKRIIADYVETQNYSEAARRNSTTATTVKRIVDADKSTLKKVEQKKEQNTLDMLQYLASRKDKAQAFIDLCLDEMPKKLETAQLSQISTAMGTTIDKFADVASIKKGEGVYRIDPLLIADGFHSIHRDILNRNHTEYVLPGGRGSTKSSFISLTAIELLKNYPSVHMLALRQVSNTLKDSVYAQIQWAIREQGLEHEFIFRKSPLEITYKETGQTIYFRGADDPDKIKSIKVPFGHIGILWFEELDAFHGEDAVRKIEQSALRGGDLAWNFKSFNPPKTRDNWANKYVETQKDTRLVHRSTYWDAQVPREWLGKAFLEEAEYLKQVNPDAYDHEYGGNPNGTGGAVFDNVVDRALTDRQISDFDRLYFGIDWGWYPDPYQWLKCHLDKARRVLYIFDEYRTWKTSNEKTYKYLVEHKGVTWNDRHIADSAEEKSVGDYRTYGCNCRGAIKGPGSVDYSMKWLQSLNAIVIDRKRCPYTYEEFVNYEYDRSKDGEIISGYPDRDNHAIDAVRYALNDVWRKRGH